MIPCRRVLCWHLLRAGPLLLSVSCRGGRAIPAPAAPAPVHTVGQKRVHATNTAEQVTVFLVLLGLPSWTYEPSFSCVSVWRGDPNLWVQQG